MIPTSRNVSTFFWHFPIHAQRMCAVKAGYYNKNMLWEIMRQMCLLERSMARQCPGRRNHLMATRQTQAKSSSSRVRVSGEGVALAPCGTITDAGTRQPRREGEWAKCLVSFPLAYHPQINSAQCSNSSLLEPEWEARGFEENELPWHNENPVGHRPREQATEEFGNSGSAGLWEYAETLEYRSKAWDGHVNTVE